MFEGCCGAPNAAMDEPGMFVTGMTLKLIICAPTGGTLARERCE